MKVKTLSALAGLGGAMILTTSASASYQGLSVTSSTAVVNGTLRNVFKVYAVFSGANDYLTGVNGNAGSAMQIQSRTADGSGVGSGFFQAAGISQGSAPTPTQVFGGVDGNTNPIPPTPNAAFDSFYTIGVGAGQAGTGAGGVDETGSSPGFGNPWPTSATYSESNGGWFTAGPVEQGRAGWLGDGDPVLRVLIMQLTVSSTSSVRGTVNVTGVNSTPLAGGQSFIIAGQTFNSIVPAPGALALLGLAGLVGTRRRRA